MSVEASAIIHGTVYWPFMSPNRPNPMKQGKFTIDLGDLDKAAVKALKDMGLGDRVKTDRAPDGYEEDGDQWVPIDEDSGKKPKPVRGTYISLKSGYPPKVFDRQQRDVDPEVVANGTTANVRVTAYTYNFQGQTGLGAGFNAVQVEDLVEFKGKMDLSDFSFDESEPDAPDNGGAGDDEFTDD